jgi:hypothetical protein
MANGMKKLFFLLFLMTLQHLSFAGCDPTQFRWGCNIKPDVTPKSSDSHLIFCGATRIYVSKPQFELMRRYQRAGIWMHLLVNNEYYDGPCVPANFHIHHQRPYRF